MKKEYHPDTDFSKVPLDELLSDYREGRLDLPHWAIKAAKQIGHHYGRKLGGGMVQTPRGLRTDIHEINAAITAATLAVAYRKQHPLVETIPPGKVIVLTFSSKATLKATAQEICEDNATKICKQNGWDVHSAAWRDLCRPSSASIDFLKRTALELHPTAISAEEYIAPKPDKPSDPELEP